MGKKIKVGNRSCPYKGQILKTRRSLITATLDKKVVKNDDDDQWWLDETVVIS